MDRRTRFVLVRRRVRHAMGTPRRPVVRGKTIVRAVSRMFLGLAGSVTVELERIADGIQRESGESRRVRMAWQSGRSLGGFRRIAWRTFSWLLVAGRTIRWCLQRGFRRVVTGLRWPGAEARPVPEPWRGDFGPRCEPARRAGAGRRRRPPSRVRAYRRSSVRRESARESRLR